MDILGFNKPPSDTIVHRRLLLSTFGRVLRRLSNIRSLLRPSVQIPRTKLRAISILPAVVTNHTGTDNLTSSLLYTPSMVLSYALHLVASRMRMNDWFQGDPWLWKEETLQGSESYSQPFNRVHSIISAGDEAHNRQPKSCQMPSLIGHSGARTLVEAMGRADEDKMMESAGAGKKTEHLEALATTIVSLSALQVDVFWTVILTFSPAISWATFALQNPLRMLEGF